MFKDILNSEQVKYTIKLQNLLQIRFVWIIVDFIPRYTLFRHGTSVVNLKSTNSFISYIQFGWYRYVRYSQS